MTDRSRLIRLDLELHRTIGQLGVALGEFDRARQLKTGEYAALNARVLDRARAVWNLAGSPITR